MPSVNATYQNNKVSIQADLNLLCFEEDGIYHIYAPALDLFGYGKNKKEADKSFGITLEEFLRYTTNKGTLIKELNRLGWEVKTIKGKKSHQKIKIPDFKTLLEKNPHLCNIMDNNTSKLIEKRNICLPV